MRGVLLLDSQDNREVVEGRPIFLTSSILFMLSDSSEQIQDWFIRPSFLKKNTLLWLRVCIGCVYEWERERDRQTENCLFSLVVGIASLRAQWWFCLTLVWLGGANSCTLLATHTPTLPASKDCSVILPWSQCYLCPAIFVFCLHVSGFIWKCYLNLDTVLGGAGIMDLIPSRCQLVRVCVCLSIPPWRWAWQHDNVVVVCSFLQVEIAHISRKNIIHLHCKQLSLWVALLALFLLITLTVNDMAANYCGRKKPAI